MFLPRSNSAKYHQESYNSTCLSILASDFHSIGDKKAATTLANRIKESLKLQTNRFRNIIDFANDIMKNKLWHKVEQHLRYNMNSWNKNGAFDILNEISENATFVQLMESLGNLNHDISMVGY